MKSWGQGEPMPLGPPGSATEICENEKGSALACENSSQSWCAACHTEKAKLIGKTLKISTSNHSNE